MPFVISILFAIIGPSPDLLGHPKYAVREWTALAYTPISACFLPDYHLDPEVRERIYILKRRLLRPYSPVYREQMLFRENLGHWMGLHLVQGESLAWSRREVFMMMRYDWWGDVEPGNCLRRTFVDRYPPPFWHTSYLYGLILPGEYEWWMRHVQYYDVRRVALGGVVGPWNFMVAPE